MTCYEPDIQKFFTGGIFWNEIRNDLDAKKTLNKLYNNLTDSSEEGVESYDFNEKWSSKPTLLVLDNVETEEELSLFLKSSGESCQWLIVTQSLEIFASFSVPVIKLNPFTREEIKAALKKTFEVKGEIGEYNIAKLVNLIYGWPPILLNMVLKKIQIQLNIPRTPKPKPQTIIESTESNIRKWIKFNNRNQLSDTIDASLNYLNDKEKECFKNLFIFEADIKIPCSIIEKIWIFSDIEIDTSSFCLKLYNLALLKDYDIDLQVVELHKYLQRYFLSNQELKKILVENIKKFVEYYEIKYDLQSPDNLPDNLPLSEKKFLRRVYKYLWEIAKGD